MSYSTYTLDSLASQIGIQLDDPNGLYWTLQEKYYAIWEGLRVWGAQTNYWRNRGQVLIGPNFGPYYDLSGYMSANFPAQPYRTRAWTLNQMVQEIQYMILESPSGIVGTGMSGQVTITEILQAIQRARNRFVIDTHLPFTWGTVSVGGGGLIQLPQTCIYVHRAMWQDATSSVWTNLWRIDSWEADKTNYLWTLEPGTPVAYSESELAPLEAQLYPAPINAGAFEQMFVMSMQVDTTDPNATFNVPDEWIHAVKYAVLADLMGDQCQMADPLRSQYAETRYQQAIDAAQNARSVIRLTLNGIPLALDSLDSIDSSIPYWRNQMSVPYMAGALYDVIVPAPLPASIMNLSVDVVSVAPLPTAGTGATAYVQMGAEDIDNLLAYAGHVLTFKCGGNEFKSTMSGYDQFMKAVEKRGAITKAQIRYMQPLFGQPQKEEEQRPDEGAKGKAA